MTATAAQGEGIAVRYAQDGYAILPAALSAAEVGELRAEALAICRGQRGAVSGMQPSADGEPDDVVIRRYACIHFPHKISPMMHQMLAHPAIVSALTPLIGPDVKAMQSMLFTKGEGRPGQAWHQDEFFIPTRDRSLTAAWIALDDATTDNGCLWVLPGSHRAGVIYPDREHDDPRFDCSIEAYDFPYSDDAAVPVEIQAGSVLLFNGYLLHRSLPNTARTGLRRALINHYMSAQSLLPWTQPPEGVHVAKWDCRDIVMVAGRDPYAWRGTADITRPYIRPDRDGGCHR
jgi:phytanoyl-CoA hydroxylase